MGGIRSLHDQGQVVKILKEVLLNPQVGTLLPSQAPGSGAPHIGKSVAGDGKIITPVGIQTGVAARGLDGAALDQGHAARRGVHIIQVHGVLGIGGDYGIHQLEAYRAPGVAVGAHAHPLRVSYGKTFQYYMIR